MGNVIRTVKRICLTCLANHNISSILVMEACKMSLPLIKLPNCLTLMRMSATFLSSTQDVTMFTNVLIWSLCWYVPMLSKYLWCFWKMCIWGECLSALPNSMEEYWVIVLDFNFYKHFILIVGQKKMSLRNCSSCQFGNDSA